MRNYPCGLIYNPMQESWDHFYKTGEWKSPTPQQTKIDSIEDFVMECEELSHEEIYELFEDGITDSLRDRIIAICHNPAHPEPVRFALNVLGRAWEVDSLSEY